MNALSPLAETVFALCSAHNARHLAIIDAAKVDPKIDALYKIWLIATDVSHDAPGVDMDEAISKIERLAKGVLQL